jgi:hypothetical protein
MDRTLMLIVGFVIGYLGHACVTPPPMECPKAKAPASYSSDNRPARILDANDRVIWSRPSSD